MKIELTPEGRQAALRLRAIDEMRSRIIPVQEARRRFLAAGGRLTNFRRYAEARQSEQ